MTCKHCGMPSLEEHYSRAMEMEHMGNGKIFTIFGRTTTEILKALQYWDISGKHKMEKSKMTKAEAFKICNQNKIHTGLINTLEALGLLKFEDDPFLVSFPVRLNRFTKITFDEGGYVQGTLKSIWQDQDDNAVKSSPRPTAESICSMMFDSISADRPNTKAKELLNWFDRMGYKIVDKT